MVQISVALCLTYTTHLFFLIVSMHLHWLDACSSTDSIDEQFLLDWWFKLCCQRVSSIPLITCVGGGKKERVSIKFCVA